MARAVEIDFGGLIVRGQVWDGDANWVILLHEPGGDLDDWGALPAAISQSGYSSLAIDLPGHGLSDDPWDPSCLVELVDSLAQYATGLGSSRFFMIAPGEIAMAAVASANVKAVTALSPRRSSISLPDKTPPALILVGGGDADATARANAFFRSMRGWSVFSSLGTERQGAALFQSPWSAHALEQTLAFFMDYRASSTNSFTPVS